MRSEVESVNDPLEERAFGVPLAAEKVPEFIKVRRRNPPILRDPGIPDWSKLSSKVRRIARRDCQSTVFFFRHGSTSYNERGLVTGQHDTELTEEGRRQARNLTEGMPRQVGLIVCSNLRRSLQTMYLSVPKSVQHRTQILIDRRLNEVNLGELQGRRKRHLAPFANGDLDFSPPGGESYRDAGRRVVSAVVDIFDYLHIRDNSAGVAIVFCHAGVLRIVSTLSGNHQSSKSVFRSSFKNADCVTMSADQMKLPTFWWGPSPEDPDHEMLE